MTDPLAPFADDIVAAVATEFGVDASDLRDALAAHQRVVRENPGVDDLVYEWRRYLPYDPLVVRTDGVYACALRDGVWEQFGATLDAAFPMDAVRAVHDRQARRLADDPSARTEAHADAPEPFDGSEPMVLARGRTPRD